MKFRQRVTGPRLGTKLFLFGLALLVVPWFSYQQLVDMERILVQSQSQAQLLTAKSISTLFNGREDLFNNLPVNLEDFEALFAHPLQSSVRLDGIADEWDEALMDDYLSFGSSQGDMDGDFKLLLGERADQLYVHMRVKDQSLVTRDPDYLRLDNADHIRVDFIRNDGEDGRISLVLQESGMTGFAMDEAWRFAATGAADNRIQGYVTQQGDEVLIEFRFPIALLGSRRYFGITWVDVDDPTTRELVNTTRTLPTAGKQSFNLVVLRSPEVRNIIQGLGFSGARILVIDSEKRVRAETGSIPRDSQLPDTENWVEKINNWFESIRPQLHALIMQEPYVAPPDLSADKAKTADIAIDSSLSGEPIAMRSRADENSEIILAAHPIVSADAVIGAVVVEQNIEDILSYQRAALDQAIMISVLSLFAVFIALLVFAGRLAWRIRNLRREANAAIDSYGRLRIGELQNEMNAGDEIGDLARSVSNMLSRLHRHNTFLESMPRTLRHEINNPLNTLSTSLQNLAEEFPGVEHSKYLDSAKRGVHRIGSIVQNLADAANLEDALETEELELVDIGELLENYVANCNLVHPHTSFVYRGPGRPAVAMVSDFRIEQILDKIIDNAVDFHRPDTVIRVQLDCYRDQLQITVANRGPALPSAVEKSVFDSMVSHRGQQNRLHFGLGLYVVRIIAEYHGGTVRAINLVDGSGVAVMVQLPLAQEVDSPHRGQPIVADRVSAG
ncbi:MAG: ATP-binding protein [Pseudomonadota bacterium]